MNVCFIPKLFSKAESSRRLTLLEISSNKSIFGQIFKGEMLIRSQKTTLLEISSELSPNSRIIYKSMKVADDRIFWEYLPTKAIIGQIFHGEMLIRRQTTSLLQIFSRKLLLLGDKYESSRRCWVKASRRVIRR